MASFRERLSAARGKFGLWRLESRLKSPSIGKQAEAIRALGELAGRPGAPAERIVTKLGEILSQPGWHKHARAAAIVALGKTRQPDAVKHIAPALYAPELGFKISGVRALGEIGGPDAVDLLGKMVTNPDAAVKVVSVLMLNKIGGPGVVPHLIVASSDENAGVAKKAVEGLGEFGGEESVLPLVNVLESGHGEVKPAALDALLFDVHLRLDPTKVKEPHAKALVLFRGLFHESDKPEVVARLLKELVKKGAETVPTALQVFSRIYPSRYPPNKKR